MVAVHPRDNPADTIVQIFLRAVRRGEFRKHYTDFGNAGKAVDCPIFMTLAIDPRR